MDFGQKLKEIRKEQGLSQEQLAEKIGVSRQAITKWETGKGMPDIENMMILAEIFKTTIDELVSNATSTMAAANATNATYTSETIYDIDCETHFDICLRNANKIFLCTGEDEKLHVKLESDTIEDLQSVFKVKLDENKDRLDVNCLNKKGMSKFEVAEALNITITLPKNLSKHCEVAASANELTIDGLEVRRLEYDGDAKKVYIANSKGSIELTGKSDYDITVENLCGRIDVNQWRAKTVIHIPEEIPYQVKNKGRMSKVFCRKAGENQELPNTPDSENEVSVSGIFSELMIDII